MLKMPAEVCDAVELCGTLLHAIPWGKVGTVVACLAFTYGLAMSIAFFFYVYRSRDQRIGRRSNTGA